MCVQAIQVSSSGPALLQNIFLTGGIAKLTGLDTRLRKEINQAFPDSEVSVTVLGDPIVSSWLGGTIAATSDAYRARWMHKSEYDDFGPALVHSKGPWK